MLMTLISNGVRSMIFKPKKSALARPQGPTELVLGSCKCEGFVSKFSRPQQAARGGQLLAGLLISSYPPAGDDVPARGRTSPRLVSAPERAFIHRPGRSATRRRCAPGSGREAHRPPSGRWWHPCPPGKRRVCSPHRTPALNLFDSSGAIPRACPFLLRYSAAFGVVWAPFVRTHWLECSLRSE